MTKEMKKRNQILPTPVTENKESMLIDDLVYKDGKLALHLADDIINLLPSVI